MKRIFTLFLLTMMVGLTSFSQTYVNYDRDSRWFIGINGGGTFHTQTEVSPQGRGGYGFTFGSSIGMHPKKMFSWDWRIRFLNAYFAGQSTDPYNLDSTSMSTLSPLYPSGILQNYADSVGYFVPNFRTTAVRWSFELVLNTNRLRERTGWNFSIFGGIGVTGYHTKTDLTEDIFGSNQIYQYDEMLLSPTKSNYLFFQDKDYETSLVGTESDFEWDWMPSFGVGISYQLSPAVAMGIEHKMTWTRTDNFDGMPNSLATGLPSPSNDIYHYTSLGFKFHLFHGHAHVDYDVDTDVNNFDTQDNTINNVVEKPTQKPIIEIYDPGSSPYTTELSQFVIRANIYHVDSKDHVKFKQNGNTNSNFYYDPVSDQFWSNVVLQPGQNLFEITAHNDAGSDYETTIIIYHIPVAPPAPPIVTITNPPYSPFPVNNEVFNMSSTVLNVDSKSQIQVYFNGNYVSGFNYNSSSNQVTASLVLHEGTNTVTVTATNNAGSDSKTATIVYTKPIVQQPPVVNYVFPAVNPYTHNAENINVLATVLNVNSQSDITVKVNGVPTTNFTYNLTTKELVLNTNLNVGANTIETKAVNSAGMDVETTTIIYAKPHTPQPPVVSYLDPAVNPTTVYTSTYNVIAKVLYVNSASDITVKINGVPTSSFNYSNSSKLVTFTTNLAVGSNVIEIKAVNADGQDIEYTTIVYKKTIPQAPPVVTITYPAMDNVEFTTPNVTLTATVLNVANSSGIDVNVNGNSTGAFTFNTSTKVVTLPLTLNEGVNTIQITGTNTAGTDSKTRYIIYKKPVVPAPPTVTFVNPSSSPYLSSTQAYTVMANTTNISSKSQIVFKMNGSVIPNANYTLNSSNQVIYNANLLEGNNIFEIYVSNSDGSDEALALITYKAPTVPCIIPTVGYISPVPYSTVTTADVTIDAQINNHSAGTTVELKVNGVSQGYMTYNSGTSIASKATVLSEGSNAITVIVTNSCGTNMATFTLTYQPPAAPCVNPTLTANSPLSQTTLENTISLSTISSQVANASGISVTLNGASVPFSFDAGTGLISITNANLAVGNNTFIISAQNTCGNAVLSYNVVREVCNPPVISGITPTNASTTTETSVNFTANVSNANASEIILMFNGVSQSFNYNEGTDILSAILNLNVGTNAIAISVTTPCGTDTKQITVTREIPCQPITYALISPSNADVTVTASNYSILLHTTGNLIQSGIQTTLNGTSVPFTFDPVSGNISIPAITLIDGANTIVVTMTNACSNATATYHVQYNGCQPPVITITGVGNGATVNNNNLPFAASVLNANGASNIVLKLNGNAVGFDFNEGTGALASNLILNEGANTITIEVNGCENATQTITVNYVVPCQDITATLMQPSNLSSVVTESNFNVSLSLQNVDNAGQITATLNGNPVAFNFDAGSGIVTLNGITLNDGANTIAITATNQCSSVTTTYNVQYNGCQPPVISMSSSSGTVNAATYLLNASVTNIANQSQISVTLNGAPVSFVYNSVTGQINAEITLNEGVNNIAINANACASDSETIQVTYTIPCEPITFGLGSPTTNTASTASATYSIQLFAHNADVSNIAVTLNGQTVPFTYASDIISVNGMTLNPGANTIVVNMSNACSNEVVTYDITYNNCNTPTIDLSSNSVAVNASTYAFMANVQHVSSPGQLQLTLNGANVPFTLSGNLVTANLSLTTGTNAIVLSANTCATASQSINVVYTIPCNPISYSLQSPAQTTLLTESSTTTIYLSVNNVLQTGITATLNGATVPFTLSGNILTFSNINLVDGSNTLIVSLTNDCSNESITYTIESNQCQVPVINLTSTNLNVNDPLFAFSAQIYNISNANDIQLTVNGTSINFDFSASSHILTAQFSLNVGSNSVVLTANGCEVATSTYTINYSVPCNPITYTLVEPTNATTAVTTETFQFNLTTTNIANQSNISVLLNGNAVPFNFTSGTITASGLILQPGANTIVVTMTNDCSSKTVTYNVTYNAPAPCVAPVITFSSSANATESAYNFTATVTNIDSPSAINVTLNGVPVAASYNTSSGALTATMNLTSGANTIVVNANGCANAQGVHTVTYTPAPPPCNPPAITFTSANSSTNSTYNLTATITNIDNPANINLTVNGNAVAATYNTSTDILSATLTLIDGNNTIQIVANGCETANGNFAVNYAAPVCGTRINPGNSAWEFCLITPGGTYTRDNLHSNANFVYDGPASSLYCKPIAGGGDAYLNGVAYPLNNGSYYLFTGNLHVKVWNTNPGAMGHWNVCIEADNTPTFGNGANRPASPCEAPPCNAPVITFTSANTSSAAAYNLAATITNIDNPSAISVTLNGQPVSAAYNTGTDQLTATLNLIDGTNTIAIQANGCENVSGNLAVQYAAPAQDDNVDFDVQNNGTVTVNETACATITCLGESVVYSNSQEAYVKIQFSLNGGSSWYGFNNDQNVNGGESVQVATPSGSNLVIKATCTNANNNWSNTLLSNSGSQYVYVLQNGDQAPTYNPADGQQSLDAFLTGYIDANGVVTIGPNDVIYLFELRHVGSVGVDYQDCVMLVSFDDNQNCPAPVNPKSSGGQSSGEIYKTPVIVPVQPATNAVEVSSPQFAFKTKIDNVNGGEDIQVTINGNAANGFSYNMSTKELTGTLNLAEGATVIGVKATNGDKTANSSFTITYKPKTVVDPNTTNPNNQTQERVTPTPEFQFVSPASANETTSSSTYMLKTKVLNVSSKANIKMTVNGVNFVGFTYSSSSQEITAVLSLRTGANTVVITATNGDKTSTISYTINYTPTSVPVNNGRIDGNSGGTTNGTGTTTGTTTGKGTGTGTNTGTEQKGGGTTVTPTEQKGGGTTVTPTEQKGGGTTVTPTEQKGGGTTVTPTEQKGGGTTVTPTEQKGGGTTTGTGTQQKGGTTTSPNRSTGTTTTTTTGGGRGGIE